MSRIITVNQSVDDRKVFDALVNVNLQAAVSNPAIGTMLVVDPNQEDAAITLLQAEFKEAVTISEARLYVPTDWSKPGFIAEMLQNDDNVRLVMTSGLGLLLA